MYVGESERGLREVFHKAGKRRLHNLLREIDALASTRSMGREEPA